MIPFYVPSTKNIIKAVFPVVLVSCIIFLTGCQKKEEKPVQQTPVIVDTMKNQPDTSKKLLMRLRTSRENIRVLLINMVLS